jgi:glycyl-tRNA synthetase beta chain
VSGTATNGSTAALVVELVTEELPPKALKSLGEAFAGTLARGLAGRGVLEPSSVTTAYATPRRLAVALTAVRTVAPDEEVVEKLLPVKVARDASGAVSQAFAKKLAAMGRPQLATATLDAASGSDRIFTQSDGKAEYVYLRSLAKGGSLQAALQAALEDAIGGLPIPKVMAYAGAGGYFNDVKFVRPAHRLVALHGDAVVPVHALGLDAGRTTLGHRFLSRGELAIASAEAWAPTLEAEGKVMPSFAARRAAIVAGLDAAAAGAAVIAPDALLDEVTSLVEQPHVYAGTFDAAFLDVPQECLILTMQQNQKYFALADDKGRLVNRFLVVANIAPAEPVAIIEGNQRVLRARLADAKFFYDQDRRDPLATRVGRLASVVYHNRLGSQMDRVERVRAITAVVAQAIGADAALADRAALLAKADLVTDMVGEFPELQGTMGRYYALGDGEAPEVADAIAAHYAPRFAGDALPATRVAQAVALADKLESLAGLFGIGQVPTGDKDPFGLRRAALGVIRILVERDIATPIGPLVDAAFASFHAVPAVQDAATDVIAFLNERLRGYLREQGYTANEVAAVVDRMPSEYGPIPGQLAAIRAFEQLPEAPALAAANKRIVNILRKSGIELVYGGAVKPLALNRSLLTPGAEKHLAETFGAIARDVDARGAARDWTGALVALAATRPAVDAFFDDVMVMADDPDVRANRLELLRFVAATMNRVADIGKLAQ